VTKTKAGRWVLAEIMARENHRTENAKKAVGAVCNKPTIFPHQESQPLFFCRINLQFSKKNIRSSVAYA
jgi:hypothetical protein